MTESGSQAVARLGVFVGEWFSPLDFEQRFTGTFSQDGTVISGAWEKRSNGAGWAHDFDLTYRKAR